MIELTVYNRDGKEVDQMQVDEALLGSKVRLALLKQALVMYHANRRQGSAFTRSRGMVTGSTAKLYRQKGALLEKAGMMAQEDGLDENVREMVDSIIKSSRHRFGRYLEQFRD